MRPISLGSIPDSSFSAKFTNLMLLSAVGVITVVVVLLLPLANKFSGMLPVNPFRCDCKVSN
jgi:hypothetical protein